MRSYNCELIFPSKNKFTGVIMKTFITIIFVSVITIGIFSQPLNGSYTIGGSNPDFITLQEAANSLMTNGVSGPVIFSIRPGTYLEQNGRAPVMLLEQAVSGVSETNTITFKPDENVGGNVNNVILQIDSAVTVIGINVDFVRIYDVTVQDLTTSGHQQNSLIRLRGRTNQTSMENIHIFNCRFLGSPVYNETPASSNGKGTNIGVWIAKQSITHYTNIIISDNYMELVNYGVFINQGNSFTNLQIHANVFKAITHKNAGTTNVGAGIDFDRLDNTSSIRILENIIDFSSGSGGALSGIRMISQGTISSIDALIDKNQILNRPGKASGSPILNNFSAILINTGLTNTNHEITISNNFIAGNKVRQPGGPHGGRAGITVVSNNAKIYYNSILNQILDYNESSVGISIDGENIQVINNIVHDYAFNPQGSYNAVAYGIYDTTGLISDYNVFDVSQNQKLAFVGGTGSSSNYVYSVVGLQEKSGKDSNSVQKPIEFVDSVDLHLTNCQMQDPEIAGIPIPGITLDIDGDTRSITTPTRGADEAVLNNFRHWVDAFQVSLPGSPFSIAADRFSNIVASDIAVPDFDNNQVLLFHNLSTSRSFQQSGSLSTPFSPIATTFYDFDDDGNLDLIVGGQNPDGIRVFWGDGSGGFPQSADVQTPGAVLNLLPEPFPIVADTPTIFVPFGELIGILRNFGNRQICFEFLYRTTGFPSIIDTLPNFIHSAVVEDLYNDGILKYLGVDHTSGDFMMVNGIDFVDDGVSSCPVVGTFVHSGSTFQYPFETGWFSYANSIDKGDFDNDGDLDFITLGLSLGTVIFIRNEGNNNFSYDKIFLDDFAQAVVALDYENDGDPDFVTANYSTSNGITLFLNDGSANFVQTRSCFQNLISGFPRGIVASDFDLDGRTDIAVSTSFDQFAVLYNADGPTSVEQQQNNLFPNEYVLEQNFPNPFNPSTTIEFSIPEASVVTLKIYNILGEEVKTLVDEFRERGNHSVQFNANNLASGIYFYKLQAGSFVETKKMILLR